LIKIFVLFSCCLNNKFLLYLLSNKMGNESGPERVIGVGNGKRDWQQQARSGSGAQWVAASVKVDF
jgi:hypothetical protein